MRADNYWFAKIDVNKKARTAWRRDVTWQARGKKLTMLLRAGIRLAVIEAVDPYTHENNMNAWRQSERKRD